jgi:hypothetical protein
MFLYLGQKQKVKNSLHNNHLDKPIAKAYNKNEQLASTATVQKSLLFTKLQKQKVLSIRRQLKEGKYDLDKKLDTAIDRVLEKLLK